MIDRVTEPAGGDSVVAMFRIARPMFMAGYEATELRGASVRGILRFWWRAAAWPKYCPNLNAMREKESELFGSAATGAGLVRVTLLGRQNITPPEKWSPNDWKNYSAYGMSDKERSCLAEGSTFELRLQPSRRGVSVNDETIARALKLLGLCGGMGARSRNGWGSVTLQSLTGVLAWRAPSTREALRTEIESVLKPATQALPVQQPPFTALSAHMDFAVGRPERSAEAAHKALISHYRPIAGSAPAAGGRFQHPSGGGEPRIPKAERIQFGLPRNLKGLSDSRLANERRAKPLFLHIHHVDDSAQAVPVALYLPADFLHEAHDIPGDGRAIRLFMDRVRTA